MNSWYASETGDSAASDSTRWFPNDAGVHTPAVARVYNAAVGDVHNLDVDRALFDRIQQRFPGAESLARAHRLLGWRIVRRLVAAGITQFLDIGCGIPALGGTHEIAQEDNPAVKVVYVDIDPIAVGYTATLLADNPRVVVIDGDLRDPDAILYHPAVVEFLDLAEPVGVLTLGVWPFIPATDQPAKIVETIGQALVAGSYLAVSHLCPHPDPRARKAQQHALDLLTLTPTPAVTRTPAAIAAIFGTQFEMLAPGLVPADQWHPDPEEEDGDQPPQPSLLAGLTRKRFPEPYA